MKQELTTEEIVKHLLTDLYSYKDNIEHMLIKHLEMNDADRTYWDAWFSGKDDEKLSELA